MSHPVHMERFGIPGKRAGSGSRHGCRGSIGMLAFGAGGLDVAMAMAGEPLFLDIPGVMGIRLTGQLPDSVSAKDAILEMLRGYDVDGGVGTIFECYGPGLESSKQSIAMWIANMGTELGATTTVFPSDNEVRRFLRWQRREGVGVEIMADEGAGFDLHEEIRPAISNL